MRRDKAERGEQGATPSLRHCVSLFPLCRTSLSRLFSVYYVVVIGTIAQSAITNITNIIAPFFIVIINIIAAAVFVILFSFAQRPRATVRADGWPRPVRRRGSRIRGLFACVAFCAR